MLSTRHQSGATFVSWTPFSPSFRSSDASSATKYIIGLAVAIPSASLCINRRLYYIVSIDSVTKTHAEKRRDILVDLAIGLGIPILEMILREYAEDCQLYCWLTIAHRLYCPERPLCHH